MAHGADANLAGRDSLTPLHICTRRGDVEGVNALLDACISTAAKTADGLTALDIAKNKGYESIYARLMESRISGLRRLPSSSNQTAALIDNIRNELPSVSNGSGSMPRQVGSSRRKSELNRLIDAAHATNDRDITASMQQLQQLSRLITNPAGANAAATSATAVAMPPAMRSQRSSNLERQQSEQRASSNSSNSNSNNKNASRDGGYSIINQPASSSSSNIGHSADSAALAALQRILDEERAVRTKLEQKVYSNCYCAVFF